MTTRSERLADKATNEKHTKVLFDLLQMDSNQYCADCRKKDPRWASWNIGVFICIQCSGVHRSLGTHISKVKSVDLDTWVPEQIESMIQWGNQRANTYWEDQLDQLPPTGSMDNWIRAKYEQKKWARSETIPKPSEIEIVANKKSRIKSNQVEAKKMQESNNANVAHYDYAHGLSLNDSANVEIPKNENPAHRIALTLANVKPAVIEPKEQCKFDLASFQQQLSMLAKGRPSTGLIPKAPEGSEKSWGNIIPSKNSETIDRQRL